MVQLMSVEGIRLVRCYEDGSETVPFSMPKGSSRGRSVSLQTGKGIYWSWPWESVIWDIIVRWLIYGPLGLLVKPLKEDSLRK